MPEEKSIGEEFLQNIFEKQRKETLSKIEKYSLYNGPIFVACQTMSKRQKEVLELYGVRSKIIPKISEVSESEGNPDTKSFLSLGLEITQDLEISIFLAKSGAYKQSETVLRTALDSTIKFVYIWENPSLVANLDDPSWNRNNFGARLYQKLSDDQIKGRFANLFSYLNNPTHSNVKSLNVNFTNSLVLNLDRFDVLSKIMIQAMELIIDAIENLKAET